MSACLYSSQKYKTKDSSATDHLHKLWARTYGCFCLRFLPVSHFSLYLDLHTFVRLCLSLLYWERWAELWRLPQSLSSPFGISHPFSTVHDSFLSSWTTTTRTLAGSVVIPLRTFKKHMNLRYLTLCLLCVFPSLVFSLMISQVHDQDLSNESSFSFLESRQNFWYLI